MAIGRSPISIGKLVGMSSWDPLPWMIAVFPASGIAVVYALVLIFRSYARRGGELRCRACEYELTGVLDRVERCPECGADLQRRRAVARGRRVSSKLSIAIGIAMFVFGGVILLGSGTGIYNRLPALRAKFATTLSLIDRLPTTGSVRWSARSVEVEELACRIRERKLSAQEWDRLIRAAHASLGTADWFKYLSESAIERLLSYDPANKGADPLALNAAMEFLDLDPGVTGTTIEHEVGRLLRIDSLDSSQRQLIVNSLFNRLERSQPPTSAGVIPLGALRDQFDRAIYEGAIPKDLVTRYLSAIVRPQLTLQRRGSIPGGSTVHVSVEIPRSEELPLFRVAFRLRPAGQSRDWRMAGPDVNAVAMRHEALMGIRPEFWITLPREPGDHTIECELELSIYEWASRGSASVLAADYADPAKLGDLSKPLVRISLPCRTIVSVSEPLLSSPLQFVKDPAPERVVMDRGRFSGVTVWKSRDQNLVRVDFTGMLQPAPVSIAADVLIVQDWVEHPVGWILQQAGARWNNGVSAMIDAIHEGPCIVKLRPHSGIVQYGSDAGPLYGREIIIEAGVFSPSVAEWEGAYGNDLAPAEE